MIRTSEVIRNTNETKISLKLNLDGTGENNINTGIKFFDHMLEGFSKHGFFDVDLNVDGDLLVDGHHTVEDTGIVIGTAIKKAVGDKKGIKRYGSFILPMDDVLCLCAIDLCGRPFFAYDAGFNNEKCGEFETALAKEFFYAISYSAEMNLHIKVLSGENDHHKLEAIFKSFSKALDEAVTLDARIKDVLSTKGTL